MALRSRGPPSQQGTDEEDEHEVGTEAEMEKKRAAESSQAKKMKRVKFELEETAVSQPSPPEEPGSDSGEDVSGSFLAKREQNIKANKAMVSWKAAGGRCENVLRSAEGASSLFRILCASPVFSWLS